MASKRLCLSFTADQPGQEGLSPAPRGLVLSELSDFLNEIEWVILNGKMKLDLARLSGERIHPEQITILQEVLQKAGFELVIKYKNPFKEQFYLLEPGTDGFCEWKSNALLLVRRLK